MGVRLRTSPPLSSHVRVCKHKIETSKFSEHRGEPSRLNVTTAGFSDRRKRTSDTTPMVTETERDTDPPQPPQSVISQLDPQQ